MIGLRSGQAVRGSEFRYRAPAALCFCLKAAAAGARRRSGSAPVPTLIRAPDGIRGIPDRAGSAALTFPFANRSNAPYSLIGTLLRLRRRTVKYRTLGRTGIKVSPYCLGAMMFGAVGNPDHDDSIGIIHKALDAGLNFVDTADAYSRGESEEIVGQALKGRRDDVVLATKAHLPMAHPRTRGLGASAAGRSIRPVPGPPAPTRTPTWRKPLPVGE
jgi:hypothetical protein